MKEVEIKVKVRNIEELKTKLEKLGFIFAPVVTQNDTIFTDPHTAKTFDALVSNVNFLRTREQEGRLILTLKIPQTGEMDCIERETEFSNLDQMKDIIDYLGYEKVVNVNKRRAIARKEGYEISLDSVEGLGDFLEVESIVGMDVDGVETQKEMWSFLTKLGLDQKDEVTRGYDTLVYLASKEQSQNL